MRIGLAFALGVSGARAAVLDLTPTDVTPRAFSVVWVSDVAPTATSVRVFLAADGTSEVTGSLAIAPAVVANGIVKIDVGGALPGTCYYVQSSTTAGSVVLAPATPPFLAICTPLAASAADATAKPIPSDVVALDLFAPDGLTPGTGTLLLASIPGSSAYPIASWVGNTVPAPAALADLGRFFDATTQKTLEPVAGAPMTMTQLRGLLCPGAVSHRLLRYRRVPAHLEVSILGTSIAEMEPAVPCHFADTSCDGTVSAADSQRVVDAFFSLPGSCRFNPDLDLVSDGEIDVLDLQRLLNRWGEATP